MLGNDQKTYIMMEERQTIKDSVSGSRKYGSTSNYSDDKYAYDLVTHTVSNTDTLPGIALKYGVNPEIIRRANKLWANDSLFLRETLVIPIKSESSLVSSSSSFESSTGSDLFLNQSLNDAHNMQNGFHKSESIASSSSSMKNDDEFDNVNDFLQRIDADIANKTQQVRLTQDNSMYTQDYNTSVSPKRKPAMSRMQLRNTFNGITSTSHVQNIQKKNIIKYELEGQSNEVFEL